MDEETAQKGLGKKGSCPIPEVVWKRCVPIGLPNDIENWDPTKSKVQPRRLSEVRAVRCNTLVREGFLERQYLPVEPNCSAFPKPKTKEKCSFILDMRNFIEQQSFRPPPCSMPSISDVFETAMKLGRGGEVYASTIDVSKFYWSLVMPNKFWSKFRLPGCYYKSLPFGWDYAAVIAHETLRLFLSEFFSRHTVHHVEFFYYLDDIILLATDPALLRVLTQALCNFLVAKGLVISPKSCTEPSQAVCWIGKKFDFKHMRVENPPSTTLKSVVAAVRAAVQPMSPKHIERITGRLQWFFGPRHGATSFLYGWHRTRWKNIRHTHRPSNKLVHTMFEAIAIGAVPYTAPPRHTAPLLAPFIAVDTAETTGGYRIGLSTQ